MERVYSIDYIKFFAIFAVVIIHTTTVDTQLGLILNTISRFAVPFFFVASGYLVGQKLLKSNIDGLSYVKKYLMKTTKIFGSWLLIYVVYDLLISTLVNLQNGKDVQQGIINYFNEGFNVLNIFYYGTFSSGYQLWFLPALIWSTIIVFLFHKLNQIKLLLVISLLLNLVGLFGQAYSGVWSFSIPISTQDTLFFGLFYTSLGFFIAKYYQAVKLKLSNWTYAVLIFVFLSLQISESWMLDSPSGYFISTIFLTISIFLFVLNNKPLGQNALISKIGSQSLGIYVMHVLVISLINFGLSTLNLSAVKEMVLFEILFAPVVFVISYFAYNVLQKLKYMVVKPESKKSNQLKPIKSI
ncbi:acyltransferase [Paenibacillus sp. NRS-1760]|uniref:acyltransferase n=1 Tax=Paenibacillus sp. NRS-1760 TaxID=3233902 RepID=UPI003D295871